MKKGLVFVVLLLSMLLLLSSCSSDDGGSATAPVVKSVETVPSVENSSVVDSVVDNATDSNTSLSDSSGSSDDAINASVSVKSFLFTGVNFKFLSNGVESPNITVKAGDKVRIEFTSSQGFHDWMVKEFDAKTKQVSDGQSTFVEFVADKKGSFEYYCSVGSHRAMGMKGMLIVE